MRNKTVTSAPAIILVRPQLGENIGAAARAMKNFGLSDLRIVAPRDGWPNEKAETMAAGAEDIIAQARIYPDLPAALADTHRLYAATARRRELRKPALTPRELAGALHSADAALKTALMFGPERSGLENDEVALADGLIHIPTAPFSSLNLAQSVVVCAYELWAGQQEAQPDTSLSAHTPPAAPDDPPATKEELGGLFEHLERELDTGGYFRTEGIRPHMIRNLRSLLTRASLTSLEVQSLRGVVRSLAEGRPGFSRPDS